MTGTYKAGIIELTTKAGKRVNRTDAVSSTASDVTFFHTGLSVPRRDVKEIVIRSRRDACCESLALGVLPLVLLAQGIRNHDLPKDTLPFIIVVSPEIVGMAAVTGPPLLIIDGIRRLKPAKVLYKVIP